MKRTIDSKVCHKIEIAVHIEKFCSSFQTLCRVRQKSFCLWVSHVKTDPRLIDVSIFTSNRFIPEISRLLTELHVFFPESRCAATDMTL